MILFVLLPLAHVVVVEVTVLAHSFRVAQPVRVWALRRHRLPSENVVAVVAHALGVMLLLRMRAPGDGLLLPVPLLAGGIVVSIRFRIFWP